MAASNPKSPADEDTTSSSHKEPKRKRRNYDAEIPPFPDKAYVVQGGSVSHIYIPGRLETAIRSCGDLRQQYYQCLRDKRHTSIGNFCSAKYITYMECISKYRQQVPDSDLRGLVITRAMLQKYQEEAMWYLEEQWKEFKKAFRW